MVRTRIKHAVFTAVAGGALAAGGVSTLTPSAQASPAVSTATAPCRLPGNPAGAAPTATPFILNYDEYVPNAAAGYAGVEGDLNANDAFLLVGKPSQSHPVIAGATMVAYYKSYQDFYDAIYAKSIPSAYKWVAYDPEQWTDKQTGATPGTEPDGLSAEQFTGGTGELGDPTAAMAGFIQLAHRFGYKVLVTPSPDLTYYVGSGQGEGSWAINAALHGTWKQDADPITTHGHPAAPWPDASGETLSQAAAGADIYEVQNQAYEASEFEPGAVKDWPGTSYSWYQEYAQAATLQAIAANPALKVFAGLGGNRAPDAAGMEKDFTRTNGLAVSGTTASVSGYWLNITPSEEPSAQTWKTVTGFLAAEPKSPACTLGLG